MPHRIARTQFFCQRITGLGLAALICCFVTSSTGWGSELRHTPIVRAVLAARPSVVNIRGEKTLSAMESHSGQEDATRRVNGMGTGVIVDPRGYVVTNYHVVDGVRQIKVTTGDGTQYEAKLVSRDVDTDLAIIKLNSVEMLPVIELGTSTDLMPGETVVAVGNAYGYEHTVTLGIISALNRAVQVSDAQFYDDLIQTDASINPGNSGGPLLNIDGEMIGINVAVRAGAQGIGFAIPVDKAMAVVAKMLAQCTSSKTWHGVILANYHGASEQGLSVTSVEKKSPAAESGLQAGDRILSVENIKTKRELDFHRALLERNAGEKIELAIVREGNPMTLQLTLAAVPSRFKTPSHPTWQVLGLELKQIPDDDFRKSHRTRYRGGLCVASVRPNSPASNQGIRPGDVLVGMHIWETISMENVSYILNLPDFAKLNPVKFFILRGNETLYGYLPVASKTTRRQ
ncbi:MAG: trypsin-like peptidase domain-containing protein [Thermoguttaceae bacterium]